MTSISGHPPALFSCTAVLPQAEMAILDEIDSGLDIDALRDVAGAVNGLKTPERSVLMVTHYRVRAVLQKCCPSC